MFLLGVERGRNIERRQKKMNVASGAAATTAVFVWGGDDAKVGVPSSNG